MGAGPAARLTAAALALALAACSAGEAPRALALGDSVPAEWLPPAGAAGGTPLVWVFRTADCLQCQGLDYPLRRLQASHGGVVPLVAVHVGAEADTALVRAFFAQRRLRVARLVTLSPRRFRRAFPGAELPALYLVRGGEVAWTSTARPVPGAGPVRLDSVVSALRAASPR